MARPERPEKVPLTKERVLHAAVDLADRGGLESLSMRKLADELGAGAMSLYYYFPTKEALIDGMIDVVFEEIDLPSTDVDWKTAMRRRASSTREALNRHRWAVGLMEGRMNPGPASARLHEAVLACLRQAGFSIENTIHAYSAQDAYIYGFALQERSLPFDDAEGAKEMAIATTDQFPDLAEHLPYHAEVVVGHVAKAGYDFASEFEFGLDVILDGLERLREPEAPPTPADT